MRGLPAACAVACIALPSSAQAGLAVKDHDLQPEWTSRDTVAVADFDQDGLDDVAAAAPGPAGTPIAVFRGKPDGGFEHTWDATGTETYHPLVSGDINEDGDPDLVALGESGIQLFLGSSGATFEPPIVIDDQPTAEIAIADLDDDGHADVIEGGTFGPDDYRLSVLPGIGDGTFAPAQELVSSSETSFSEIDSADLNEDGIDDLVIGRGNGAISTVIGGSLGPLTSDDVVSAGHTPWSLGDYDGDDHVDLVTSQYDSGSEQVTFELRPGAGDGTFGAPSPLGSLGAQPGGTGVATGDFDGDGLDDLAVTYGARSVRVFFGQAAAGGWTAEDALVPPLWVWPAAAQLDADPMDELLVAYSDGLSVIQEDSDPPTATIDAGPPQGGTTADDTPTFEFSSDEAGSTFECTLDDGDPVACDDGTFTPGQPLSEASHTFSVVAIDAAGNRSEPTAVTFTVAIPPETTIDSGPADGGETADSTPTFGFSSNETGSTFACSVDGGLAVACDDGTFTPEQPLADGPHTFSVVATDPAGNADTTAAARSFTVADPPETSIDSGPVEAADTTDDTPTFEFSSDETNSTFECALDEEAPVPCDDGTFTPAQPLPEASHTFSVVATDAAGNADPTPATRSFRVAIPPETTIDSGPAEGSQIANGQPTFGFSSNESGTFACKVDSGATVACNGGTFTPAQPLGDGSHTFAVVATDAAGNADPSAATRSFTVADPPETTITGGPGALTNQKRPTIQFSSDEPGPGSSFGCTLDAVSVPCSGGSFTPTQDLSDGSHTFTVAATDPAHNTDASPASRTFKVDATKPTAPAITSGPGAVTKNSQPQFTFNSTDNNPGVTYRCGLASPPATACNAGTFTPSSPLADGTHTFFVLARDAAGNDSVVTNRQFTVDTAPPGTTVSSLPQFLIESEASVTYTATETGSTFECRLDGDGFQSCPSTGKTYSGLDDGQHTIEVRAIDAAGNADGSPAATTFTVDTHAPDTAITSGPEGLTRTVRFGYTANETATFACRVDYEPFRPCAASGFVPSQLDDGLHVFFVRATDRAGNIEASPDYRLFTLDATAPRVRFQSFQRKTRDRTPSFIFEFGEPVAEARCLIDGQQMRDCDPPVTTPRLKPGKHKLKVVATDEIGNVGTATARFTVKGRRRAR